MARLSACVNLVAFLVVVQCGDVLERLPRRLRSWLPIFSTDLGEALAGENVGDVDGTFVGRRDTYTRHCSYCQRMGCVDGIKASEHFRQNASITVFRSGVVSRNAQCIPWYTSYNADFILPQLVKYTCERTFLLPRVVSTVANDEVLLARNINVVGVAVRVP